MYFLDTAFILCLVHIYNSWNDKYNKDYELYISGGLLIFSYVKYYHENDGKR